MSVYYLSFKSKIPVLIPWRRLPNSSHDHGTGVIAGGSMRAVLESAGVTDVLAKSLGSANPHNVVKATFKALAMLREPINVARQRNLNLKKVFNG